MDRESVPAELYYEQCAKTQTLQHENDLLRADLGWHQHELHDTQEKLTAARALATAHRVGWCHGDISFANVFVSRRGDMTTLADGREIYFENVKVIDWGEAKKRDGLQMRSGSAHLEMTDEYAPPEVLQNRR